MIYFDNAATGGFKPPRCIEAAKNAMCYMSVNAGHSGHRQAIAAEQLVYKTRKQVCDFFNADKPERVIFTKNCTEALNAAIFGTVKKGGNVVASVYEHNSVLRPLFHLRDKGIITLTLVKPNHGAVLKQDIEKALTDKTYLVCLTGASNVTGEINDYEAIGGLLHEKKIIFLVDGAQVCGHAHVNMKEQRINILCFSGHKGMHSVQGLGGLVFDKNTDIKPFMFGGSGTETFAPMPSGYPELLECGTLNLPAIASLSEGILYNLYNLKGKQKRLLFLTEYCINQLCKIKGIRLYSHKNPVGIVSFAFADYYSQDITDILSRKFDIATRGGFHCAPLAHDFLKTKSLGLVRASFSEFNDESEIDYFVRCLNKITPDLLGC